MMKSDDIDLFLEKVKSELENLGEKIDSNIDFLMPSMIAVIQCYYKSETEEILNFVFNLVYNVVRMGASPGRESDLLADACNIMFDKLESNFKCVKIN